MFGSMFYKITKKNVVRICNYGKSLMLFSVIAIVMVMPVFFPMEDRKK